MQKRLAFIAAAAALLGSTILGVLSLGATSAAAFQSSLPPVYQYNRYVPPVMLSPSKSGYDRYRYGPSLRCYNNRGYMTSGTCF